ncbi:MAG: tetratricopeptide repeat protein [Puniceicoccaceae bacterium]
MKLYPSIPVLFLMVGIALMLGGCLDAERRLEHAIKEAVVEAQQGNSSSAINRLESLQDAHPDHPEIAEALAIAYEVHGNYLLASNYYQKAARLAADKRHLLKASAKGQIQAGRLEDAAQRLVSYLESFPEDGETWLELGRIRHQIQPDERAADALTRGILLTEPGAQQASDFQKLGSLYLRLKDFASADYYLNQALALSEQQPSVQSQVLVDLAKSSVEQSDWDVADLFLKRIASTFPDMLATAEVQQLQETVRQILELRQQDTLPSVEVTAAVQEGESEEHASTLQESGEEGREHDAENPAETDLETDGQEQESSVSHVAPEDSEDSSDLQEPLPTEPVSPEVADETPEQAEQENGLPEPELAALGVESARTDAALPPGEPGHAPDAVDVDLNGTPESDVSEPLEPGDAAEDVAGLEHQPSLQETELEPYEAPENEAELLLIQAQQALAEGNAAAAIRMAWDSVHRRPENPSGWFILSRAYVDFGQNLNAESAALEALRINPKNKKIVLNYLGILQRSRDAQRFHEELLKAYQRFPSDPDFVLALARSYARIQNDPANAAALYRRFFDLAPEDAPNLAAIREESTLVQ